MRTMIDYRSFRLYKLNTPQFCHLKLLLFWPAFSLVFFYLERLRPLTHYYPVHCFLDDLIPFCEYFAIPYLFWFVFVAGMLLYTLLFDVPAFRRMMWFIIITYSAALVVYFLFPNCQLLRPAAFERDNIFTRFMAHFYVFDTNTNVCPSIHVIGSMAAMYTGWHARGLSTRPWRVFFTVSAVLISLSTVFLKQHSILDVLAALPICVLAYWLVFLRDGQIGRRTYRIRR